MASKANSLAAVRSSLLLLYLIRSRNIDASSLMTRAWPLLGGSLSSLWTLWGPGRDLKDLILSLAKLLQFLCNLLFLRNKS